MSRFPKILLFDIDATLLLTGGVGRISFQRIFKEKFGIDDAWAGLVPDGKTDPLIFDEIALRALGRPLSPAEYRWLCRAYSASFKRMIGSDAKFRLMPGVKILLQKLASMENVILGLQTGNFEDIAWIKLERGQIRHHFEFGGFGSDHHDRALLIRAALERGFGRVKKSIPPRNIFIIGDSVQDVTSAKRLGLRSIAVTTGRASYAELQECGPDFLLKDLSNSHHFTKLILS